MNSSVSLVTGQLSLVKYARVTSDKCPMTNLQNLMSDSKLPALMPRLKAAQRREQLIEVATKLFARSGYDATTTAAIAIAAGVTEPILYRHFKSKQELFVAIVRDVSANTMRGWAALSAEVSDPAE